MNFIVLHHWVKIYAMTIYRVEVFQGNFYEIHGKGVNTKTMMRLYHCHYTSTPQYHTSAAIINSFKN